MALQEEQAKSIKEQILKQAESFPEDKREEIKAYILSMNNEQLEEFIIKNKLIKQPAESGKEAGKQAKAPNECVFCLIAGKQIESFVIYEDKDYIAVLEINPFSPGHTILLPKQHIKETKQLKAKAFTIADKIGKHLVKHLRAESFQISTSDELKHALINIIPIYKGKPVDYKRKSASKPELQELAIKIGRIEKKPRIMKIKTEKQGVKISESKAKSALIKLPRRIP